MKEKDNDVVDNPGTSNSPSGKNEIVWAFDQRIQQDRITHFKTKNRPSVNLADFLRNAFVPVYPHGG